MHWLEALSNDLQDSDGIADVFLLVLASMALTIVIFFLAIGLVVLIARWFK